MEVIKCSVEERMFLLIFRDLSTCINPMPEVKRPKALRLSVEEQDVEETTANMTVETQLNFSTVLEITRY